ncbi:nicotinamidase/pyrazinamidase [Spiroplasma sp. TIUS-1]|uniref:isochorismatase family protein n=1 Tax=Spiroplasma sp. TIUS-1 TaxID=216963 RepID=UPI0013970811|nr:isochorismatase family protein [Spiroplasma sp. TIUS-1]QHX35775.1 nicotinamidase/pyrazinamidase [Spiroplasma sp. TIUS-1]
MAKCLLVVDYQYDFAHPKGSLYVSGGETIKQPIIDKIKDYKSNNNLVVFSGDFHPENHISFRLWPVHCVVGTNGSGFMIDTKYADLIIRKGTKIDYDSYSAFYIGDKVDSGLDAWLKANDVTEIEVCGLALDVCVGATYVDCINFGYKAKILNELSKSIM